MGCGRENIVDPKAKVVLVLVNCSGEERGGGDRLDCRLSILVSQVTARASKFLLLELEAGWSLDSCALANTAGSSLGEGYLNVRKIMKTSSYYNGRARKKDFCSLGHVVQAY